MIIIYNLSGLLLAGAGIVVGFFVGVLSGWLSLGLLTIAVIWFAGGLWWRNHEFTRGVKQPFPAVFFIPLPFLAVPVAFAAVLLFLAIERGENTKPVDPRAALFEEDERFLSLGEATGDVQLSQKILAALQPIPGDGQYTGAWHVTTRKNEDAVLVLVKATGLKNYKDNTRMALVRKITDILEADEQLQEKRFFIGIKGWVSYGVVQTPPNHLQIGSTVPETTLYAFYDESAELAHVALAGSPRRKSQESPRKVPEPEAASGATPADAGGEPFPHEVAKRAEDERPDSEAVPGEPGAVDPPEDTPSPGATEGKPAADEPPADKPPPRARTGDRAPIDTARRSAEREARRAESKKRSDEQMADLKKRSDARRAEAKKRSNERTMDPKKRSDERVAASLLNNAEIFRKVGNLATYRKRLQEIVDKYPETEAGKKAAELLE